MHSKPEQPQSSSWQLAACSIQTKETPAFSEAFSTSSSEAVRMISTCVGVPGKGLYDRGHGKYGGGFFYAIRSQ